MAEYIERTEELVLAMNAGARASEHIWRCYSAVYTKDLFSDNSQEISYLLAAKVLLEVSDAPAADVAPVVRCRECKYSYEDIDGLTCVYGPCVDCTVPEDFYCKYGEREEE